MNQFRKKVILLIGKLEKIVIKGVRLKEIYAETSNLKEASLGS